MSTLTKDQFQKLSPDQQTAIATVEARRVQKRERLLKQARNSRRSIFATAGTLAVAYGAASFAKVPFELQMSIFALMMAIFIQTITTNRRIDALIELLEDDHAA